MIIVFSSDAVSICTFGGYNPLHIPLPNGEGVVITWTAGGCLALFTFFVFCIFSFNPNRLLESKVISSCRRADWPPSLSKVLRAAPRENGRQDAGNRMKAFGKPATSQEIDIRRSNDRFGFNKYVWVCCGWLLYFLGFKMCGGRKKRCLPEWGDTA